MAQVEATTFKDVRVVKALGEMLVVRVDAERYPKQVAELGVEGVPAIVVVAPDGKTVISRIEAQAMMQPETLLPKLAVALPARPKAALPRSAAIGTPNGAPDQAAWKVAGVIAGFHKENGSGASEVATRVLALAGPDALFLSASCPEPKPEAIVAKADARDADQVWQDDCIEFFVEPVKGSGEERHFAVSAGGMLYDSRNNDKAWNGDWTATAKRTPEGWAVEVRIPWATLGLSGQPKPGVEMGFNAGRVCNADGESSQWSLTEGSGHQPMRFGTLKAE